MKRKWTSELRVSCGTWVASGLRLRRVPSSREGSPRLKRGGRELTRLTHVPFRSGASRRFSLEGAFILQRTSIRSFFNIDSHLSSHGSNEFTAHRPTGSLRERRFAPNPRVPNLHHARSREYSLDLKRRGARLICDLRVGTAVGREGGAAVG